MVFVKIFSGEFVISIPHQLERAEALIRAKQLMRELDEIPSDRIKEVKDSWDEAQGKFTFLFRGALVSGSIKVNALEIEIKGELPFWKCLFRGSALEETICRKAELLFKSPATMTPTPTQEPRPQDSEAELTVLRRYILELQMK